MNVTLDDCCDHRAIARHEDIHFQATSIIKRADVMLLGRMTYEMMRGTLRAPMPAELRLVDAHRHPAARRAARGSLRVWRLDKNLFCCVAAARPHTCSPTSGRNVCSNMGQPAAQCRFHVAGQPSAARFTKEKCAVHGNSRVSTGRTERTL